MTSRENVCLSETLDRFDNDEEAQALGAKSLKSSEDSKNISFSIYLFIYLFFFFVIVVSTFPYCKDE